MASFRFGNRSLVVSAAVGLAWATASPADALPAVQTGLVGLARLQAARLNLVHLPPVDLPPNPCIATLSFLDDTGRVFVDRLGQPISLEVTLDAGESAALELPSSVAFLGRRGLRQPFRTLVEVASGPPDDCAGLVTTLEVYEEVTGRTTVLYVAPGPPEAGVQADARLAEEPSR
jgi:hypothetical protein